jgi:hypothetical protein
MGNISDQIYALYERLASAKLNELINQINSHNHGSSGGVTIDVTNAIADNSITTIMLQPGSVDSTILAFNSVTTNHIVDGTITYNDLNTTSIHLSADGYAVYAP